MQLQTGNWVETESGQVGKVVHISRLTVFVAVPVTGKVDRLEAFREDQLTKTKPPGNRSDVFPNPTQSGEPESSSGETPND
jgi:hypothetical protein